MVDLDLTADIIDVRDIIERVEELEKDIMDDSLNDGYDADAHEELEALLNVLSELRGNGGDHQWRGDWYPVTLIRDSHFTDYARELCEDCGYIPSDLPSFIDIDWNSTALNLLGDYTGVEIDGVHYWYR